MSEALGCSEQMFGNSQKQKRVLEVASLKSTCTDLHHLRV